MKLFNKQEPTSTEEEQRRKEEQVEMRKRLKVLQLEVDLIRRRVGT